MLEKEICNHLDEIAKDIISIITSRSRVILLAQTKKNLKNSLIAIIFCTQTN